MPGAVNFYLKKPEPTTGRSLIYLKYKYGGNVLVFTFDQTIDPANWNGKKQRVKSNTQTTRDGDHSLNDLLGNLEEVLLNAYKSEKRNGTPLPATLKKYLSDFLDQNEHAEAKRKGLPTLYDLIDRFVVGEIKGKQGKESSEGSRDNYGATKKHLMAFQESRGYKVDFDTVTLDFFYAYVTYLKKEYTFQPGGPNGKTVTGV